VKTGLRDERRVALVGAWPDGKFRSGGTLARMDTAAAIILGLFVLLPAVLVGGLFVWAARRDGQEGKAL